MSCRECLHYKICCYWLIEGECKCDNFTPAYRWIYLYPNVGDTVYYITGIYNQLIKSAIVKDMTFDRDGITSLFVTDEDGVSFDNDIDTFYLSYEEAEKALED